MADLVQRREGGLAVERQVFRNGRHSYEWQGKSGALPNHGQGPVRSTLTATRLGQLHPQLSSVTSRKSTKNSDEGAK
jgi:hypothetical protein